MLSKRQQTVEGKVDVVNMQAAEAEAMLLMPLQALRCQHHWTAGRGQGRTGACLLGEDGVPR